MSDCLTYAIHYLSKYPKTVADATRILQKKWFPSEDIVEAIPQLEKSWYLDDRAYTRAYLHSEVSRKGKPVALIKQKLLLKGIEKNLLNELIDEMAEEIHEGESAKITKEIARLRAKQKNDPEIVQALVRKWFRYEDIRQQI